jgi:hypothetical protein
MIGQNREILQLASMGLITVGGSILAPEYVNQHWLRRRDRRIRLHRLIRRAYPVLNLVGAAFTLSTDEGLSIDITAEP